MTCAFLAGVFALEGLQDVVQVPQGGVAGDIPEVGGHGQAQGQEEQLGNGEVSESLLSFYDNWATGVKKGWRVWWRP